MPSYNPFQDALEIEREAKIDLVPWLLDFSSEGRVVLCENGNMARELQHIIGDAIFKGRDGKLWTIDWKTEKDNITGNFFFETWSNLTEDTFTPGWMFTLKTDLLGYYFIKQRSLYLINFQSLKKWSFFLRNIYKYPEKPQSIRPQANMTFGRCVPIKTIEKEVLCKRFYVSNGEENS